MAENLKIPEKVYVGFQGRRTQDEVPLGFMVPYTDDDAGTKRQATVDRWAASTYTSTKSFNGVILDNTPMIGFKIGRAIRRSGGWNGGGATYIRIEDPRGFELETTIENLVMVNSTTILERGEIMHECVWAREGTRNILIPTNSEVYLTATISPASIAADIPLKEVQKGDTVVISSTGETGVYLGLMAGISSGYGYWSSHQENRSTILGHYSGSVPKKTVVKITNTDGTFSYVGFAKISVNKVVNKVATPLTPWEIDNMVLDDYTSGTAKFLNATSGRREKVHLWFTTPKGYTSEVGPIVKYAIDDPLWKKIETTSRGESNIIMPRGHSQGMDYDIEFKSIYDTQNAQSWSFNHGFGVSVTNPNKYMVVRNAIGVVGVLAAGQMDYFFARTRIYTSGTGVAFTVLE